MDDDPDRLGHDGLSRAVPGHAGQIGRGVREEQAVESGGRRQKAHADRHRLQMRPQHFAERPSRGELLHPREFRRLFQRSPQRETEEAAKPARHESDAPGD